MVRLAGRTEILSDPNSLVIYGANPTHPGTGPIPLWPARHHPDRPLDPYDYYSCCKDYVNWPNQGDLTYALRDWECDRRLPLADNWRILNDAERCGYLRARNRNWRMATNQFVDTSHDAEIRGMYRKATSCRPIVVDQVKLNRQARLRLQARHDISTLNIRYHLGEVTAEEFDDELGFIVTTLRNEIRRINNDETQGIRLVGQMPRRRGEILPPW